MSKVSKYIKKSIAILLVCFACVMIFSQSNDNVLVVEAKTEAELQDEIEASKDKIEQYNAEIDALKDDINKQQEYQNTLSAKISTVEGLIQELNEKIAVLEENIAQTEAQLILQEAEIIQGVEDFKERLRVLYLSGSDSYAELLVGTADFYDLLMKMELITEVAEHDDKEITALIDLKNDFELTKLQLEETKRETEATKDENQANKDELTELYSDSVAMQAEFQTQQNAYQNMTAAEQADMEAAQQELDRLIEERRLKEKVYVGGTFTWPVPTHYYISSYYGPRWGGYHYGIDIAGAGIAGQPIVAANAGEVIIAFNDDIPGYSYGKYVAIDHGGGYVTVYGHASKLAVSVGDTVSKGETIAYVGTTGNSTGYHLHFEIRENNVKKDPMLWFTNS